jgi:hypothetical protein
MGCLVDLTWQRNICFFFIKKKVFLKEINFFCFKLIKKIYFKIILMCELPGSVYEADRNGKLWLP